MRVEWQKIVMCCVVEWPAVLWRDQAVCSVKRRQLWTLWWWRLISLINNVISWKKTEPRLLFCALHLFFKMLLCCLCSLPAGMLHLFCSICIIAVELNSRVAFSRRKLRSSLSRLYRHNETETPILRTKSLLGRYFVHLRVFLLLVFVLCHHHATVAECHSEVEV